MRIILRSSSGRLDPKQSSMQSPPPKAALADLAKAQRPYAMILGCSDSRVPPELVFDATLGEFFVVRVAGNVMSPEVMASMQYACAHLGTRLVVVLGHEGCGAAEAVLAEGNIQLVGAIYQTAAGQVRLLG